MARVALVTGGTRGIGRAISEGLKEAGYTVAANYASNDKVAAKYKDETGIPVYKFSISDFDECAAAIAQIKEDLGPVEILVNNAGITRDKPLHKMSKDDWDAVVNTNLSGLFNMCRNVINDMRDASFGRIISISSINGQKGQFGQTNYAAAKAGDIGFTKALALETASKGITVNAVAPGFIDTAMTKELNKAQQEEILRQIPLKRMGAPEDIAHTVDFLASKKADYITGTVLHVNGGMY